MRTVPNFGFQISKNMKMYDGTTKPEDWLDDYVIAVCIAGGNRTWVVRYVPAMLEGAARVWLNNMPRGIIDCYLDFEEAFIANFASTYRRPNRSQLLANYKQRSNETDREYLTRWSNVRNSRDAVSEQQAIGWFAQGYRHGTSLWQRLQRKMPTTMAETIRVANSYALGDPTQPMFDEAEGSRGGY
jgi:hypothetical protein